MHSVRCAALRAASSLAPLAAASARQQLASLVVRFSKPIAKPTASVSLARYFSQSTSKAEREHDMSDEDNVSGYDQNFDQTMGPLVNKDHGGQSDTNTVFISNMTFDATDMHLREAFGKYGEIVSVNIGRDGRGLSRGFGFITFATPDAANRAVAEAHKSFWHGRRINVDHRQMREGDGPRGRQPLDPTDSLYIGNIPYETSDADLNRLFRELENVTDVRVAVDRNTGWPRGFAHADFTDVESAIKAHDKLLTTSIGGRQLRVDYSEKRKGFIKGSRSE